VKASQRVCLSIAISHALLNKNKISTVLLYLHLKKFAIGSRRRKPEWVFSLSRVNWLFSAIDNQKRKTWGYTITKTIYIKQLTYCIHALNKSLALLHDPRGNKCAGGLLQQSWSLKNLFRVLNLILSIRVRSTRYLSRLPFFFLTLETIPTSLSFVHYKLLIKTNIVYTHHSVHRWKVLFKNEIKQNEGG
jgi:hypothetical protein